MNETEWYKLYDETNEAFKWFFIKYHFELEWAELLIYRAKGEREKMLNVMEKVFYELPDNKFNIIVNPKGWSEFLNLLEA